MVDKNIIQSRFTKLGVVPIDNQHYLYATLDNNLIGIIVFIKTCDNHYYDEDDIKVNKVSSGCRVSAPAAEVELTDEEKKAAREAAIKRLAEEQYQSLKKKPGKKKTDEGVKQMSLF